MEQSGYTVKITNLASAVTTKNLRDFLDFCGAIQHVEIVKSEEDSSLAYVTFKNRHAMETAILLNGATLLNQPVTIAQCNDYKGDRKLWKHSSWQINNDESNNVSSVAQKVAGKGYMLGKGAVAELGQKTGLSSKVYAGIEVARIMDEKYGIVNRTKSVASVAGSTARSAGNAVVSSSYFSRSALWVSGALSKASQIAADMSKHGAGNGERR